MDLMGSAFLSTAKAQRSSKINCMFGQESPLQPKSEGVFTFSREEIGSTAGYELFDEQAPEVLGEKVAKLAIEQLNAKSPKGGKFPVVLGPNVVGVFVHEAFGHLAEADLALSGGVLASNLGKKIGFKLGNFL